ncbi:unnamed protein product [Moneuplotes crassus]|uniref:Uncharacterized protein n=1 Tax=Euplotes crassus TaxID=5936 RepID=A0AAD1XDN7_EUPCR|nr:unnamed protein product [Moneuplotes crassus]
MSVNRQIKEGPTFNQNEVLSLKKKMRHNEAEFAKERAVMKQKIDLLQNQVKELIEREANQKRMYETMLTALKDQGDEPKKTQDYFDKQLAKSDQVNKEGLQRVEQQYLKKQEMLQKENAEIQLENAKLREKNLEAKNQLETKTKECDLKLQEAKLTDKEKDLKIKLVEEENEKLKKEIELLNQKLKDQNEINSIKTARLEEKLRNKEASDAHNRSIMMIDPMPLSVQSIDAPAGFGRSRSPVVGKNSLYKSFKKQQDILVDDLQNQISQKDDAISELCYEKDELICKIGDLENENEYLQEQVELVQKEKETSIQLLETQIKRQENEYMQQINILDSEKQNAKSMLSHLQNVIKSSEVPEDNIVRKLNFSSCMNRNENNPRASRHYAMTTNNSPRNCAIDYEEVNIGNNPHDFSNTKKNITASKCRSRNPSSTGLQIVSNSIPIKGFKSGHFRESHRSGNIRTLKELASARNMATQMSYKGKSPTEDLTWLNHQHDGSNLNNRCTQESSPTHIQGNPYKRSQKSKSRCYNTSDGGNGINVISEIYPGSKGHSEDVNGTLMNSIVNLFPNKFRSKKGSGVCHNENANPISSFTSSPHASLSKQELREKLEVIQRDREDSKIHQLRDSSDSNEIISDSPERSAQLPYASGNGIEMLKPASNTINRNSYIEMLETGEIMKNINGDLLCKRCNGEFTVQEFLNNQDHWKICLNKPAPRVTPKEVSQGRHSMHDEEYTDDEHSQNFVHLRVDPNAGFLPELSEVNGSVLLHKNPQREYQEFPYAEESEEEDGEYEEDIEEGVPYDSELDNYDLYSQKQRNNRYARPHVILETVEQESDECRSSICDSSNYISNPNKLFNKDRTTVSKAPSMRYHSNQNDKNGEVGTSLQVKNRKLNQSPYMVGMKKERSEQAVHSSLDSNSSKGSKSIYSKVYKENHHKKENSEVSVKLDSQRFGNQSSRRMFQTNSFKEKHAGSPRAFKDITHQMHTENLAFGKRKRSVPPPTYQGVQKPRKRRQRETLENPEDYDAENNPIGYAQIDLMNEQNQESDTDSLPYDQLNSKLSRIEDAVNFFYEKMSDNYAHCINEVGTIKDYIELKSEKKSNSRMNSIYSNRGSAMKTPITANKLMEFHMSSKKKNPLDSHYDNCTSQTKKYRNIKNSRDATPEMEYTKQGNRFQQFISQEDYNVKDYQVQGKRKENKKKGLSRNNSGYGPNKIGLNRYNSLMSQSTSSINQHPSTRSFALHL